MYNSIIDKTKNIILEIIKSNNLIDVKTPAFLNLRLKIKKRNDLFVAREILKSIDLIEKYNVLELTKKLQKLKLNILVKWSKYQKNFKTKELN